ncbi:MAG: DinB family protein [Chloroflexota bacterium]
MIEPTLLEFANYNQWANQQLLIICAPLNEALLTAIIPGSVGSITATFGHILRAELGFLERINGRFPNPDFDWNENPTLTQMAAYSTQLSAAFLSTLKQVSSTQNVHEENEVWLFNYQARLVFMSLIYHGISHRTDITTFLTSQGIDLPELDVWGYEEAFPDRFNAKLIRKGE